MIVIPRKLADKILASDATVMGTELSEQITVELAVQGKSIPDIEVKSFMKTKIMIQLQESGLPMLVRNVRLHITSLEKKERDITGEIQPR